MKKIRNKKTGVIKEIEKEFETAMYLGTGEWEVINDKEEKIAKTPIINTKEEK